MNKTKQVKIIVMADGLNSRWEGVDHLPEKQLLPVNNYPLLGRTIKQIKYYKFGNITLICPESFSKIRELQGVHMTSLGYRDHESRPILNGILRTRHFWSDKSIFLLGDVCYSWDCIKKILSCPWDYFVCGRSGTNIVTGKVAGELFAFGFTEKWWDRISHQILRIIERKSRYNFDSKLWDLYYEDDKCRLLEIKDYTDDTDSFQAYTQFWSKLEKAAIEDDEQNR